MNQKNLIVLGAIAAVMLGVGFALKNRGPDATVVLQQSQLTVPELKSDINAITGFKLLSANNTMIVSLKKSDAGWVAENKANYPADVAKLRTYLLGLSESKILEPKTALAESYAKLGVEDISKEDAKGVQLELTGLPKAVQLIVGNFAAQGGQSVFIRRAGNAQSYLVSGNIRPDSSVNSWLVSDIANVPSARLQEAKLTPHTGEALVARKASVDDADWAVQNVPKGKSLSSPSIGNSLLGFLDALRLEDVLPSTVAQPVLDSTVKARYLAFDGLVIEVTGWEQDDKSFINVAASLDTANSEQHILAEQAKAQAAVTAAAADAAAAAKPSDASGKGAPAPNAVPPKADQPATAFDAEKFRSEKLAALKLEVDEINKRTAGWSYQIPSFKYALLKKTMADMTQAPDASASQPGNPLNIPINMPN